MQIEILRTRKPLDAQLTHDREDQLGVVEVLEVPLERLWMSAISPESSTVVDERCFAAPINGPTDDPAAAGVEVHAAIDLATEEDLVQRNFTVDRPNVLWLTDITEYSLAQEADPELATFIMLAASSGARRGELLALRWHDLDLERGRLSIERGNCQSWR
jgi:hypothetical protein